MKSVEEIQRKLEDIKKSPASFDRDTIIDYLTLALDTKNNPEYWLKHLLNKYEFSIKEDEIIVRTLEWILDKSDEI